MESGDASREEASEVEVTTKKKKRGRKRKLEPDEARQNALLSRSACMRNLRKRRNRETRQRREEQLDDLLPASDSDSSPRDSDPGEPVLHYEVEDEVDVSEAIPENEEGDAVLGIYLPNEDPGYSDSERREPPRQDSPVPHEAQERPESDADGEASESEAETRDSPPAPFTDSPESSSEDEPPEPELIIAGRPIHLQLPPGVPRFDAKEEFLTALAAVKARSVISDSAMDKVLKVIPVISQAVPILTSQDTRHS